MDAFSRIDYQNFLTNMTGKKWEENLRIDVKYLLLLMD